MLYDYLCLPLYALNWIAWSPNKLVTDLPEIGRSPEHWPGTTIFHKCEISDLTVTEFVSSSAFPVLLNCKVWQFHFSLCRVWRDDGWRWDWSYVQLVQHGQHEVRVGPWRKWTHVQVGIVIACVGTSFRQAEKVALSMLSSLLVTNLILWTELPSLILPP